MREADTLNDDGEPMSTEELLNQPVDPAIAQRANATLELLYNELKIPVSSRVYVETGEEADAPQG